MPPMSTEEARSMEVVSDVVLDVVFPLSWETPFTGRKRKPVEQAPPSPIVDDDDDDDEFESVSGPMQSGQPAAHWAQSTGTSMDTDQPTATTTEQRIQEALNDADASVGGPDELTMDTVLEHLSNRLLMEKGDRGTTIPVLAVPVVSKAYEESYLREPFRDERACASGAMCECNFIDPSIPFIGVEFTPYGIPPTTLPSLCVLCSRKTTQKLFYDVLLRGKHATGVIQRYGNIVNAPGEYARECALVCPTNGPLQCLPVPMMSHQRNRYETYMHNGVRCIRQLRVGYEDFRRPSTEGEC